MIEVRLKITVFYGAILTEVIKNKNAPFEFPLYYAASWLDNRWFIEALNRVRTT